MQLTTRTLAPRLAGLLLAATVCLPASAEPASFDGMWDVRFVTDAGPCGTSHASSIAIRAGRIQAQDNGTRVSGGVSAAGAVSAAISNSLAQGNATGRLSRRGGTGVWNVASLGCTGRWTAERRQTFAANAP
jgi:hypothetical protein